MNARVRKKGSSLRSILARDQEDFRLKCRQEGWNAVYKTMGVQAPELPDELKHLEPVKPS